MGKNKKSISIIGGGTAALMLASELNSNIFEIHLYEKTKNIGNKFLVAGKGGFNLTHSENIKSFIEKYEPKEFISPFLTHFNNLDTRTWFENIGIETIIGSSGKIYPAAGINPNTVLKAIKNKLIEKNVEIHYQYKWIGLNEKYYPIFELKDKTNISIASDIVVFALGGASWKVTGSDGSWLNIFKNIGIKTNIFEASNCAFEVIWKSDFISKYEGKPLKNIATFCNNKTIKGELVITRFGIEGGAIYAQSSNLRRQLNQSKKAVIYLDLKPQLDIASIENKLNTPRGKKSISNHIMDQLKLDKTVLSLLKSLISKDDYTNISVLAEKIKNLPLEIVGIEEIDKAISTVGGIALEEVDENLKLNKLPSHYAIGEMLDWDVQTGGYLLQASFSMGNYLANHLNNL